MRDPPKRTSTTSANSMTSQELIPNMIIPFINRRWIGRLVRWAPQGRTKPQHKLHRLGRSNPRRDRDAPATHSVCPLEEQEDRAEGSIRDYTTPGWRVNGIGQPFDSPTGDRVRCESQKHD